MRTAVLAAVTLAKEETLEAAQDGEAHQEEQQQEQEEYEKQELEHTQLLLLSKDRMIYTTIVPAMPKQPHKATNRMAQATKR